MSRTICEWSVGPLEYAIVQDESTNLYHCTSSDVGYWTLKDFHRTLLDDIVTRLEIGQKAGEVELPDDFYTCIWREINA